MDILITTVFYAALCWVGFRLGQALFSLVLSWYTVRVLRRHGSDWIEDPELKSWAEQEFGPYLNPQPPKREIPALQVGIEQHGSQLYAFALESDQFLAQGGSAPELLKRLEEHFENQPAVKIEVPREHGGHLIEDSV